MFDIRRIQVHSLKEFLKEFMMIVIGILTAIAIEHQYTQSHKRHQAHQAAEQVRAEMQANLQQVRESIAANDQGAKAFRALEEKLLPLARQGRDKAALQAALAEVMEGHFSIGFSAVEPAQDAWDAAVSSQLVSVMPREELQRFSRIYARQRALANHIVAVQQGMRTGLWVRWNSMVTDLELGQAQPVELLKVVREHVGGLEALNRKLQAYEKTMAEGVAAPGTEGRAAH